ncbi:MAG: hypothetical protein HFI15_03545 [Lachnospiraceae bacterium]|nr:hypothetical protein [Lachnospiraceae bacterium]
MSSLSEMYRRLRSLERSLKDWENRKKTATENRDKARKRQNKVKDLKKDLEKDFDDNARSVNKNSDKMVDRAYKGMTGNRMPGNLDGKASANKEREPESDGHLGQAIGELSTEVSRLQDYYDDRVREIEECRREISRIKREISDLKRAIARKEREKD